MSPGPLTSRQHGGYVFGPRFHGHGYGRIAAPTAQQFFAQRTAQFAGARQRFSVGGDGRITLDPGESLIVGVGEDGEVTIGVKPSEVENGNGTSGNGAPMNSRAGIGRIRRRMSVYAGNDGSVTIEPEQDNTLQIVGSPEDNVIAVIELEPAPPVNGSNEPDGQ
jgi:hypothetical protein